ncbi:MAG: sigma-70 family RNA polymerase sigma factor [Planctomycetota bacterium]
MTQTLERPMQADLSVDGPWVRNLAYQLVREHADADDLAQDTWLATLRGQPRSVRPWLGGVVRKLALRHVRRRALGRTQVATDALATQAAREAPPDEAAETREQCELLVELIGELPEPERRVIAMRFVQGMDLNEIAARLEVPAGTVRWRQKRALEQLRASLDARNGGDRTRWTVALWPLARRSSAAAPALAPVLVCAAAVAFIGALGWTISSPTVAAAGASRATAFAPPVPQPEASPTLAEPGPASITLDAMAAEAMSARNEAPRSAAGTPRFDVLVVEASSNAPIEGALVAVIPSTVDVGWSPQEVSGSVARPGESPHTDSAGRATVLAVQGEAVRLMACIIGKDAASTVSAPMTLGADEARAITLRVVDQSKCTLSGRVVELESGRPIPGVTVRITGVKDQPARGDSCVGLEQVTAPDGRFSFEVRPASSLGLELRAEGFAVGYAIVPVHRDQDPARPIEVTLSRAAQLDVRVTDHAGRPLAEANVTVHGSTLGYLQCKTEVIGWSPFQRSEWTGITDSTGRCELDGLQPGLELRVEAQTAGGLRTSAEAGPFAPGSRNSLEVRLEPGCRLTVRVTDVTGAPVVDAELWLVRSEGESIARVESGDAERAHSRQSTDLLGQVVFEHVPAGTWWIAPAPDIVERLGCDSFAQALVIPAGQAELEVPLALRRGQWIQGHVVDARGRPRGGVIIDASEAVVGSTADDGTFRVGPFVEPVALSARTRSGLVWSAPITVRPGAVDVALVLPPTVRLAGEVRVGGELLKGVHEAFWSQDPPTFGLGFQGFWIEEGHFETDDLPVTRYGLCVVTHTHIGILTGIEVTRDEDPLDLRVEMQPAASVRIRSAGPRDEVTRLQVRHGGCLVHPLLSVRGGDEISVNVPVGANHIRVFEDPEWVDQEEPFEARIAAEAVIVLGR